MDIVSRKLDRAYIVAMFKGGFKRQYRKKIFQASSRTICNPLYVKKAARRKTYTDS